MAPTLSTARQEYLDALVLSLVDGTALSDCATDHMTQLGVDLMRGLEEKYRHVGEVMLQRTGCLDDIRTLYLEVEAQALAEFHAHITSATTSGHVDDTHRHRRALQACYTDLVKNIDVKKTTLSDEFVAQGIIDAEDADSMTGIKSTKAANEAFLKRACIMFAFEQFVDTFLPTLSRYVPEDLARKLRDMVDTEPPGSVNRCPVCQVKAYVNPSIIADELLEMTAISLNLHSDLKNQALSSESRWARIVDTVKRPGVIVEALAKILPCRVFDEFKLEMVTTFVCRCPVSVEVEGNGVDEVTETGIAEQTIPKSPQDGRNTETTNEGANCHAHRTGLQRVHRMLVTSLQGRGQELLEMLAEMNAIQDCDVRSIAAMSNGTMQTEAILRIVQDTMSFGQFVERCLPIISSSCPQSVYEELQTAVWVNWAMPEPTICSVCQTRNRIDPKRLADIFLEKACITVNVHSNLKTSGISKEEKWDLICKDVPHGVILAAVREQCPGFYEDARLEDVTVFDCHCDCDTRSGTFTDVACMDDVESVDAVREQCPGFYEDARLEDFTVFDCHCDCDTLSDTFTDVACMDDVESVDDIADAPENIGSGARGSRSDRSGRIQEIFLQHCKKTHNGIETDGTQGPTLHEQEEKFNKRIPQAERTTIYSRTGTHGKAVVTSPIDDLGLYAYYRRDGFFTRLYKRLKNRWARLTRAAHEFKQPRRFVFDAYILYSGNSIGFVKEIIAHEELSPFRFCVKDRDFLPGESIAGQVFDHVDKSRTVIVIRDKSLGDSEWDEYEAGVVCGANSRNRTRVLNILYDNATKSQNLTELFRIGLTISFPQSEVKRERFWKQVANFLCDESFRTPYF
ncbi:uncharacterized protein [Haliotis asinina]|uniref:uncharacterized protein n=1 Tax=Haliotis asinina TaxID=109174 RepID=UPI003532064A